MKYQHKIKQAENVVQLLKKGSSIDQIHQQLDAEGFTSSQIDSILKSTENIIYEEYKNQVCIHLLEDNLEENLDNFELVDSDTFDRIQYSAVEKINQRTNLEVNKLLRENKSREEIWDKIDNPYYSIQNMDDQIDKYNYFNKPVDGFGKTVRQLIGGSLIIIGIFLSFILSAGNKIYVFYGIVIIGIYMLTNNYKTKSDIDNDRKFKHSPFKSTIRKNDKIE